MNYDDQHVDSISETNRQFAGLVDELSLLYDPVTGTLQVADGASQPVAAANPSLHNWMELAGDKAWHQGSDLVAVGKEACRAMNVDADFYGEDEELISDDDNPSVSTDTAEKPAEKPAMRGQRLGEALQAWREEQAQQKHAS
jgi:hypothetical protein